MREMPPPDLSSACEVTEDARVDGGGSESRKKLARSEVAVEAKWASRGSNFFIGTRPDGGWGWGLGGGGGSIPNLSDSLSDNLSDPEGMLTLIGV